MSDVQVSHAARNAAADLMFEQFTHCPGLEGDGVWSEVVRRGEDDVYPVVQAFARFEQDIIARLATRPAPVGEPVGTTGELPGSNGGFSMAVFEARNVPVGTPLYTRPALDVDGLVEALRQCGEQFAFYAREHTAAGKLEKAATNQRFADLALAAIKDATDAGA